MLEKNSGALAVTLPTEREIVITRVVDAPRRLVFEAYTNPEHLPHWLLGPQGWTMPVCEVDLRPGGTWHFGWRKSDGTEMEMRGVYREITPSERTCLHRVVGRRLARNHQHAGPLRRRWQDYALVHNSLPVEGSSRRRAQDGDEGRHGPELRSSRRAPRRNGAGEVISGQVEWSAEGGLRLGGTAPRQPSD